jgi:histidinol-phosphate aminotransferase
MPLGRVLLPLRRKTEPVTIAPGPTPRPGVLDIAPYVGGEAKIVGVERPIRLASNESALGPSAKAIAAYRALAARSTATRRQRRGAAKHSPGPRAPARICGASSDRLITRCALCGSRTVLYSRHIS